MSSRHRRKALGGLALIVLIALSLIGRPGGPMRPDSQPIAQRRLRCKQQSYLAAGAR